MNTRTFGQAMLDTQKMLLANRIMLAQSEEQKECYDENSEKMLYQEFKFPIMNEDVRSETYTTWIRWETEEKKSNNSSEIIKNIAYIQAFDFYHHTASKLISLKLTYKNMLEAEQEHAPLSKLGIINLCEEATDLYKHIMLIQEYLEYEKIALNTIFTKDSTLTLIAEQYTAFRKKEKEIYDSLQPQLKALDQIVINGSVNIEKFLSWFHQGSEADIQLILNKGKNISNEPHSSFKA